MNTYTLHRTGVAGPYTIVQMTRGSWRLMFGHIIITTSATGGNRWITLQARSIDDGHILWDAHAGFKIGNSSTNQINYRPGASRETAFVDTDLIATVPHEALILPGWELILHDSDAVDEANDLYDIHLTFQRDPSSQWRGATW